MRFGLLGDFSGVWSVCVEGSVRLVEDKSYTKDGLVWCCSNRKCNKKTTIKEGSWFAGTHLLLEQAVKLTNYWVFELSGDSLSRELRIGGEHTVVDWRNFTWEVCLSVLEEDSEQIGGPGEFVDIDESKFGKMRYHRGRRVEGVWVFGGIERESKRCFWGGGRQGCGYFNIEHQKVRTRYDNFVGLLKSIFLPIHRRLFDLTVNHWVQEQRFWC